MTCDAETETAALSVDVSALNAVEFGRREALRPFCPRWILTASVRQPDLNMSPAEFQP